MFSDAKNLLDWYAEHRRDLPWRSAPGFAPLPYHVWLSEIMLQQTTTQTAAPYYRRFTQAYQTIGALARAPLDTILEQWAGLGYYARARNLHRCAQIVDARGAFPTSVGELEHLPGIGPYTARAIAAIAFNVAVVPIDGNVERIAARLFDIDAPLASARRLIATKVGRLNHSSEAQRAAGDFAQALFDLGRMVCLPRRPNCEACPISTSCRAYQNATTLLRPARLARSKLPERYGIVYIMRDRRGYIRLRRRPLKGLLAGMVEFPTSEWRAEPWSAEEARAMAPAASSWEWCGSVAHTFSHFKLRLEVFSTSLEGWATLDDTEGFECEEQAVSQQALPSVMRKCLHVAHIVI